jgi:mRNA-degrading endonuclease toxin of MazEF toxin-antitoxin module
MQLNPLTPGDKHLTRPVVIVSTNARNRHWDGVIVVPCSSSLENPNPKFHKALPSGEGGVSKDCHARCDLISNIQKSCLDHSQGPLGNVISDKFMWDIVRGIRANIGDSDT